MPAASKRTKLGKPSKHDVLASLFTFVNYMEDCLVVPVSKWKRDDIAFLRSKLKQCKEVLHAAQED